MKFNIKIKEKSIKKNFFYLFNHLIIILFTILIFVLVFNLVFPVYTTAETDTFNYFSIFTALSYVDFSEVSGFEFLPYYNFLYYLNLDSFEFFAKSNGFYLLNMIYNFNINLFFNFKINTYQEFRFNLEYEDFNFPQLNVNYDVLNLFKTQLSYSNFGNLIFFIKLSGIYKRFVFDDDILNASLKVQLLQPISSVHYFLEFYSDFSSKSNFSKNSILNILDFKIFLFIYNNQSIIIGFNAKYNYSINDSSVGDYVSGAYYNEVFSRISTETSYKNKISLNYQYFLIVRNSTEEKTNFNLEDSFSIFYTGNEFSIKSFNKFKFVFYPDTQSNNYMYIYTKLFFIYYISKILNLSLEGLFNSEIYFINKSNNYYKFYLGASMSLLESFITVSFMNRFIVNISASNDYKANETGLKASYEFFNNSLIKMEVKYSLTYYTNSKNAQQYIFILLGLQFNY